MLNIWSISARYNFYFFFCIILTIFRNNWVPPIGQLLMALWFYATGTHFQYLADFGQIDDNYKESIDSHRKIAKTFCAFSSNTDEIKECVLHHCKIS